MRQFQILAITHESGRSDFLSVARSFDPERYSLKILKEQPSFENWILSTSIPREAWRAAKHVWTMARLKQPVIPSLIETGYSLAKQLKDPGAFMRHRFGYEMLFNKHLMALQIAADSPQPSLILEDDARPGNSTEALISRALLTLQDFSEASFWNLTESLSLQDLNIVLEDEVCDGFARGSHPGTNTLCAYLVSAKSASLIAERLSANKDLLIDHAMDVVLNELQISSYFPSREAPVLHGSIIDQVSYLRSY